MLSPISTGMGDCVRVGLPEAALFSVSNQTPQLTQPSTLRATEK